MIRKLFLTQYSTITGAAFLIGAMGLLSRLLGVVRARIFAEHFGASGELDMFYAAVRVPDLVFNVMVLGAVSAAFLPVFTEYLHKDRERAWRLAANVLNILALIMAVFAVITIIFAPTLVRILAPGFEPARFETTVLLTRLMLLQPVLLAISNVMGGVLQTFRVFLAYSLAPLFYNIGLIGATVLLVPRFGVFALAWGIIAGAAMHMLIQLPSAIALGFRFKLLLNFAETGMQRIMRLMLPRALGLAVLQVNTIVITAIASTLTPGSISILNYANDIQYAPLGIIGIAFAIAAFPALSEAFVRNNLRDFAQSLSRTIGEVFFVIVPFAALFFVLRDEIVTVILSTARFGEHDITTTALTIAYFAPSIAFQGIIPLLSNSFYALQNTITPVVINVLGVMLNAAMSLYLAPRMGVAGFALAFSISGTVTFLLLLVQLNRVTRLALNNIFISLMKIVFATASLMLVSTWAVQLINPYFPPDNITSQFFKGIVAALPGLAIYLTISWLFKLPELTHALRYIGISKTTSAR